MERHFDNYSYYGDNQQPPYYPCDVDDHAYRLFGAERYFCKEFQDEAYLFVPFDERYYEEMAEVIQTRWDSWKNIQKNAVDWDGPTPLAKAFEKYLGCPTEYFPPMPDDDPLRAALAYATQYGQRDGFVPVLIVEDETLWETLIFNSDHANDGAEDYKFDPDKVAEYRKQLLEKPTKNASEVLDRLIGDRRCEAEDDEIDWDEEILGEVAGGETTDHCAWWNSETNLTHPIILAKIPKLGYRNTESPGKFFKMSSARGHLFLALRGYVWVESIHQIPSGRLGNGMRILEQIS